MPKKVERRPFCLEMVLYFMLEALDALYFLEVLMVKVHCTKSVPIACVELTKKTSHCKSRAFSKTHTKNRMCLK